MKFIFIMMLFSFATSAQTLSGSVLIDGVSRPVKVVMDFQSFNGRIQIGIDTYRIISTSGKNLDGELVTDRNGRRVEDKKVQIIAEADQLLELRKLKNSDLKDIFQNAHEIDCRGRPSAFIILSDDLKSEVKGNCAQLK